MLMEQLQVIVLILTPGGARQYVVYFPLVLHLEEQPAPSTLALLFPQ
jgi:hypothetical protein